MTAYSAVVELYFPQGIAYSDDNANLQSLGVTFKGEYRAAGSDEWLLRPVGTQGFAGDAHIWFGQGGVGPSDPNPPENPAVSISVPSVIDRATPKYLRLGFDQEVYQVSETGFLEAFTRRTADSADVTDLFTIVREVEVTANRVWQYEVTVPTEPDDSQTQYYVATNLQNFTDAPPPNGVTFPSTAYVSNNFSVVGADVDECLGLTALRKLTLTFLTSLRATKLMLP